MARERKHKETRTSYANNPHTPYSGVFEVFEELMNKR